MPMPPKPQQSAQPHTQHPTKQPTGRRTIEVWGGYAILPAKSTSPSSVGISIGRDISLAIEGGRIIDVGSTKTLRSRYSFHDSIGSPDSVLCPGFVDAHLHSPQIATRGIAPGRSLLDWLKKFIWKWEGEMTKSQAHACAMLAYVESIRNGVTSVLDYTSVRHTEQAFLAAKRLGIRAVVGKTMMDCNSPPSLEEDTDASLRETESLIRRWHGTENGRLRSAIVPRFSITSSDDLLCGAGQLMAKYGQVSSSVRGADAVLFTTHANESQHEVREDKRLHGKTAIARFKQFGLLGKKSLLVHCVWMNNDALHLLAKTNTHIVHCPGSNMMLASGSAPVEKMLAKGMTVALGSDIGAYYNAGVFDQMRLAVLLRKAVTFNPITLTHQQVFEMATVGGAGALGIDAGALKKGRKADVILLSNLPQPNNDLASRLVYCGHQGLVTGVVCDGKILMRDGKILVADEEKIAEKAKVELNL